MKTVVPDYYKDFRCLAGECRHSCCIGWEIDIDDNTLAYYKTVEGPFAQKLADGISCEGGTAHFCMDSRGRCAFLNEKGLCEIMLNLGFDKVSQICDDHPRFCNFYSDRTETGLGLSCEAVAQMLINRKEKTVLVTEEDDEEWLWPEEWDFLELRDEIFARLQDRSAPVEKRAEKMLQLCGAPAVKYSPHLMADFFMTLEKLEDERDTLLEMIKNTPENRLVIPKEGWLETAFEQLLVYFAFRHLADSLDDGRLPQRGRFCVLSALMIYLMAAACLYREGSLTPDRLCDIARIYSAEIEYSTENIEIILEWIEKQQ